MSKVESSTTEFLSEEERAKKQGAYLPQYIAAIAVCMGALAAGTVVGWTSNITEELINGELNGIQINVTALGWIGSFAPLGAMVMCFPIGILCDMLGRKLALLLFTIPFAGGWLLIIFSKSVEMLYVGRFITGLAGGAFCVAAPLYITEIAVKEIRGTLGTYFQLFLSAGVLLASTLGYVTTVKLNVIVLGIVPLLFALIFVFQPETPIYKMKQKQDDKAKAILIRLRGTHYDVDAELKEIKLMLEEEENNKISFQNSIKKRSTRKAAVICFSLMFFQQAGGINAIVFYASAIFKASGASLNEKLSTIIITGISIICVLISSRIIEKLGRRILLILSGIFTAVGLGLLGVFFSLKDRGLASEETLSRMGFVPLLGLSIYIIAFALGYAPIPWMMSAELFPQEIKSTATAAVGTFNWFMAFITTKFYLNLQSSIGGDGTFYLFSGVSFLGAVFAFIMVPETKGKSLYQIQKELNEQYFDKNKITNPKTCVNSKHLCNYFNLLKVFYNLHN